jgi:phospho-N-acetylmuramoyl-pentapeptide-transferase
MNIVLIMTAIIISFTVTAVSGKWFIPFLKKLRFGQTIREVGPSWHKDKQGTPTMGGMLFVLGITVSVIITLTMFPAFSITQTPLLNTKTLAGLSMALGFGVIGFIDDYISVIKKRNLGLKEWQKLVLQFSVAGGYLFSVYLAGGKTDTIIPFLGRIDLGFTYYILAAVLIVGMVNAVNLTDGIDGLNSIVCFFSFLAAAIGATILSLPGITVFGYAAAAACLGFLVWNFKPAKVFMGDLGSLFYGGVLCALAFGIDMPILLLPLGFVSICEILSVVLQVSYFKLTHGKRIFKMSPVHHHFEMMGWSEVKICGVFGFVSLIGAVIAVLLIRYSA